jgi:hypothetical protein
LCIFYSYFFLILLLPQWLNLVCIASDIQSFVRKIEWETQHAAPPEKLYAWQTCLGGLPVKKGKLSIVDCCGLLSLSKNNSAVLKLNLQPAVNFFFLSETGGETPTGYILNKIRS